MMNALSTKSAVKMSTC